MSTETLTTQSSKFPWKPSIEWGGYAVIILLAYVAFFWVLRVVRDIGNLFGWLIGSSLSPIGSAVAPLIFGLLATVVFASVVKFLQAIKPKANDSFWISDAIVSLCGVLLITFYATSFVHQTRIGYSEGSIKRAEYKKQLKLELQAKANCP